jgi:hypothetical protein
MSNEYLLDSGPSTKSNHTLDRGLKVCLQKVTELTEEIQKLVAMRARVEYHQKRTQQREYLEQSTNTPFESPQIKVQVNGNEVVLLVIVETGVDEENDTVFDLFEKRNEQMAYGTSNKRKIVTRQENGGLFPVVTYQVKAGECIKTSFQKISGPDCHLQLVYVGPDGDEFPEECKMVADAARIGVKWHIRLEDGENYNSWLVRNGDGKTVLRVVLQLESPE